MLRVTRLTDYATIVLAALAEEPERIHSAAGLAEQSGLELPTVAKLLKPLARAGLVSGFRGSAGGYRLARPADSISLIDIVEQHCGVRGNWRRINDVIAHTLRGMSLAQMLPGARPARAIPMKLAGA